MEAILRLIKSPEFLNQAELFLRILISIVAGLVIGYERTNRGKDGGVRTHTIVAIASCLMMIISQYGFGDFFGKFTNSGIDLRLDPSRVAAQIVSGVGFLGAGMIFIQKNTVTGLTTAAGIWATAGIGMALGCGMYFMGIACTVIIVVLQWLLHKSPKFSHLTNEKELSFVMRDNSESMAHLIGVMKKYEVFASEINYKKKQDGMMEVSILAQCDSKKNMLYLLEELYSYEDIKSLNM